MRVHLRHRPEPDAMRSLEAACRAAGDGPWHFTDGSEVPSDTDVLVAGRPTKEQLLASPHLRALVFPYAGLPPATRTLLLEVAPDLPVHNQHHNAEAVAEAAVGLVFAAAKRVVPMDRALRAGDWRPRYAPDPAVRLGGKRALVLGYGAVGRRVARMLRGLGLTVTATRRTGGLADENGIAVHPAADTLDLLASADILVLCLPGTPETTGLLDASALARLPHGALLVNIARAAIVDEDALFDALQSGRLAGAGLDVWWRYPAADARHDTPPATRPFHELDNLVMSPHRTGHGPWVEAARYRELAATLVALARGEEPASTVDVRAGY